MRSHTSPETVLGPTIKQSIGTYDQAKYLSIDHPILMFTEWNENSVSYKAVRPLTYNLVDHCLITYTCSIKRLLTASMQLSAYNQLWWPSG